MQAVTPIRKIIEIKVGSRFRKEIGNLESLQKSIAEVGLLHPIVISESNELIAGLRRLRACEALGWMEIPVNVVGLQALRKGEIDENSIRKDFTVSEMVAIKRALEPEVAIGQGKRTDLTSADSAEVGKETRDIVSSYLNISHDTLAKAEVIVQAAEQEPNKYATLLEQVDNEKISVSSAQRKIKRDKLIQQLREKQKTIQPINGVFDVIVVDPPWPLGFDYDPEHWRGSCPYPEMSLEQIKNLKLPISEHAIVWLWCPNAFLHEAYHILEVWQLSPKTVLTWAKDKFGLGVWLRGQTEQCILAVKGSPKINLTNQTTLLQAKVTSHSAKPDEFYNLVESLCFGSRLDYFARKPREGWTCYGTLEHS